jgi:hypothetical protein
MADTRHRLALQSRDESTIHQNMKGDAGIGRPHTAVFVPVFAIRSVNGSYHHPR